MRISKLQMQRDLSWTQDMDAEPRYLQNIGDLGSHAVLEMAEDGQLHKNAMDIVRQWEQELQIHNTQAPYREERDRHRSGIRPPTGKGGTMSAYYPTELKYREERLRTTSTNTDPVHIPQYRGTEALGTIKADLSTLVAQWETIGTAQQPDLYHIANRGGAATIWKRTGEQQQEEQTTVIYDSKPQRRINKDLVKYEKVLVLDNRRWTYLRERCAAKGGDKAELIKEMSSSAKALQKDSEEGTVQYPHWWVTERARQIIQADTLIGIPQLMEDPGFDQYESPQQAPAEGKRRAVIWDKEGITPKKWEQWLQDFETFILITDSTNIPRGVRIQLQEKEGLHLTTLTPGTDAALSIESWAKGKLQPINLMRNMEVWKGGPQGTCQKRQQWTQEEHDTEEHSSPLWQQWPPGPKCPAGWKLFWKGDQLHNYSQCDGVLACTDGSFKMTAEGLSMGAGIAYRKGDRLDTYRTSHRVEGGKPGAYTAEGISLLTCVRDVGQHVPLTIGIDNSSIIYATARSSYQTYWKELEKHEHREMLTDIVLALQARTAPTTLVKVKAHVGQILNEEADRLADKGTSSEAPNYPYDRIYSVHEADKLKVEKCVDDTQDTRTYTMREAISIVTQEHIKARRPRMLKCSPLITASLGDVAVGRALKAEYLAKTTTPPDVVRDQILWHAHRTPCAAWMKSWNKKAQASIICRLCHMADENVAHLQCTCTELHEMHVKAHNDCWRAVWETMVKELQRLGYEVYFETPLGQIPDFPFDTTGYTETAQKRVPDAHRKPDAVLIKRKRNRNEAETTPFTPRVVFLDFARTSGNTEARLEEQRRLKEEKQYTSLLHNLRTKDTTFAGNWSLDLLILNVSYSAAIDLQYWGTNLRLLGLGHKGSEKAIKAAIRQSLLSYSEIERTRKARIRNSALAVSFLSSIFAVSPPQGVAGDRQ